MIRHKAFVFKLKPDGATRRSLAKACGCVRFVYNKGLDWNKEQREKDQTFRVNYPKLCACLLYTSLQEDARKQGACQVPARRSCQDLALRHLDLHVHHLGAHGLHCGVHPRCV